MFGYFAWALTTTFLTRFIINVQRTSSEGACTTVPIPMAVQYGGKPFAVSEEVKKRFRFSTVGSISSEKISSYVHKRVAASGHDTTSSWLNFDEEGQERGSRPFLPGARGSR
jgi:hypothetical protein